ncbi:RNA polymerase sigma factor SigF [Nocardioides hankookensis]|uniref:Sigma-70 family RNA polymerase sigma factor n=1 Tax=Nocardioides hankookensis TaxID=443157 RepID=A0ABW1LMM4_9ACTN
MTLERQTQTHRLFDEASSAGPAERRRMIDEVIVLNLPVARSIAGRYRGRGVAVEDLEQVAYLALVRAANKFEPAKAEDFLSYAVPTIRGEIRRYFRDHGWMVRPPRRVQEVQSLIQSADVVPVEGGGGTTTQDLAERLGLPLKDVSDALQAQGCFHPSSLDAPAIASGEPLGDLLVDDDVDEFEAAEARALVRTLVTELKPRDRLILYLRFFESRTQQEIGDELGVTQMQVSRLLSRILADLRARAGASTTAA